MYSELLNKINHYNKITIFRHERPDGDAVFSSYALKEFINTNFPNKKVYLVGKDKYDILKSSFKVSNKDIKDSLCIILDTATKLRVDDKRGFELAEYIVKIDHHPPYENYGNLNYVESSISATSELLAKIFYSNTFNKYKVSKKCAKYLFSGIVTDTLSFKIASVSKDTFKITSKLMEDGDFNVSDIYYSLFKKSSKDYESLTKLRTYIKFYKKVAYMIIGPKDIKKIGMSYNDIKNSVETLSMIDNINIWGIFVYNESTKLYDGSIRSLNGYIINKIAAKYNGGGHDLAVGVKSLKKGTLLALIKELASVKRVK